MNKELNAAEAVYGFVGWLTSREERTVMSAKDDCAPIAELIKRFCTENNLPEVSDQWPLNLIHPSGEVAVPNAVLAKWVTPAPVGAEPVVACGNCGGSGRMVRDPDIGTDQECFVCDGSGSFSGPATQQDPVERYVTGCSRLLDEDEAKKRNDK